MNEYSNFLSTFQNANKWKFYCQVISKSDLLRHVIPWVNSSVYWAKDISSEMEIFVLIRQVKGNT